MNRCIGEHFNPLLSVTELSIYNDIAAKLLDNKFILTALEFYVELNEAGTELPILKEYFENSNNFENHGNKSEPCTSIIRSSSQATLDSLDMARYSEDGVATDERVAVLEFELRKARENISALRANLTVITESESVSPDEISDKIQLCDTPIKPHEQRALNFLVNEYLMVQSYKLTSITFSDENENQDFEDWEDVGLDIPKPSNLLQIYREFYRKNDHNRESSIDASVQVDFGGLFLSDREEMSRKKSVEMDDTTVDTNSNRLGKNMIDSERAQFHSEICFDIDMDQCEAIKTSYAMQSTSNATTPETFRVITSSYQNMFSTSKLSIMKDDSVDAVLSDGDIGETDSLEKNWMNIRLSEEDNTSSSDVHTMHGQIIPETSTQPIYSPSLINVSVNNGNKNDSDLYFYESIDNDADREEYDNNHYNNDGNPINCSIDFDDKFHDPLQNVIAKVLPEIVPYIAPDKRNHVIPLIINTVKVNCNILQRDKLLRLLFNLKKKPQQADREILLRALVTAVRIKNSAIEPEGIITLCWELCQHKYPEKRLLAIECCTSLAPHTSGAIKNSLMISMLQQILLEDKEPIVRVAVVRTLAFLVTLNDDPDKYFQCEELALAALDDESSQVFDIAHTVLLPTLAQWALSLKRLLSHLIMRIIAKLKNLLKPEKTSHRYGRDHYSNERIVRLINVLRTLLPYLIVCVADNSIVRSRIRNDAPLELPKNLMQLFHSCKTNLLNSTNDNVNIVQIINTFLEFNWENNMWPELEWLNAKLYPDVMMMIKLVNTSQEVILTSLLSYVESLCSSFGCHTVLCGIKKTFESEIVELEKRLSVHNDDEKKSNINLTLIPAYILILSIVDVIELSNALRNTIVLISTSDADVNCLIITIRLLSKRRDISKLIVDVLWDGVVHQNAYVRSITAKLFGNIIANIPEHLVTTRIVPAIVTLSSDSDLMVKATAVEVLGELINSCPSKEAKDKSLLTLESIIFEINCSEVAEHFLISWISTLASIVPNCPQHFIEEIIAKQLGKISALGARENRGNALTIALLNAYSILVHCFLNNQCITNVLLPGLGHLQSLINQQLPQENENIRLLIRGAESRVHTMRPIERSTCPNTGLSLSITAANVGQGVEDMRQRMTKMFTPKSLSPSAPSIFRKN